MKIVFVAEWGPLTGGGFAVVSNLINTMLKLNTSLDIHVVSFGEKNETVHKDGYTIHLIEYIDFPTARYWYLPRLLKNKILEINPDLIHLHFTYPPYSFIAQLSIPVVITVHGLSAIRVKGSYAKRNYLNMRFIIDPYFEKKALQSANKIIAVSMWMKDNVDNIIGVNPKTVYIPNGIDVEEYSNIEPVKDMHHPSIFFVGRLIKIKGVDILIKALQIIKTSIPDIHLYIAGEGPLRERLESLAVKLNVDKNITFLGFVSDKKIQMLASTDVFVMPSRFESFGIVALEALAAGAPVVAANVGGIPDILDNGRYGILVEPENPEDLAQKIIMLIENPDLRKKLSEMGKQRAKEYSWDHIAKRTLEIYHSVI